jgi:acyl dehydratase
MVAFVPTVSDHARDRIGEVTTTWTSDPVSIHQVRAYLAATGGDLSTLNGEIDQIAVPPMFFYSLCRRIVPEADLLPDGQHADLGVAGVTGKTVAGGHHVQFHQPLKIGDVLTARERLVSITDKIGTQGPLVLVTTETVYDNQDGERTVTFQATTVFL